MTRYSASTIYDDFSAGTFKSPLWDSSYGDVTLYGGYARIGCASSGGSPAYSALYTTGPAPGDTFTFDTATLLGEFAELPAAGGATVAYAQVVVLSPTAGTYIGILYDAVSGYMSAGNYVGYSDAGLVVWAYDAASKWFRFAHDGTALTWATSPDGVTWTTRRTEASAPAWLTGDVEFMAQATRADGVNDYAGVDNINVIDTTVTPPVVVGTAAIPATTVSAGATVTPTAVAGAATVPGPALSTGVTVTPGPVVGMATIPGPSVSTGVTVTPVTVVGTATIPAPSVSAGVTVTPDPVVGTAAIPGPTLSTAATVTPAVVVGTAAIPGVTISTGAIVTPPPILGGSVVVRTLSGAVTGRVLSGAVTARTLSGLAVVA